MESLNVYWKACRNNIRSSGSIKLEMVDQIVKNIVQEIMCPPYDMTNSSFIVEMAQALKDGWRTGSTISPLDAWVVTMSLAYFLKERSDSAANIPEIRNIADSIFKCKSFPDGLQNPRSLMRSLLNEVRQVLEDERLKEIVSTTDMRGRGKYPDLQKRSSLEIKSTADQDKAEPSSNNVKIDESDRLRIENKALNVQKWHESLEAVSGQLLELQPIVSGVLEKIMSFSKDMTEGYVLQFAKMQIEFYDLIADNYDFHVQACKNCHNRDYINAVNNYAEFLILITENLSVFGVEEIKSEVGERFDGKLHEVVGNDLFQPRMVVVKKSIRSGFKYKDIILQKEKIII